MAQSLQHGAKLFQRTDKKQRVTHGSRINTVCIDELLSAIQSEYEIPISAI